MKSLAYPREGRGSSPCGDELIPQVRKWSTIVPANPSVSIIGMSIEVDRRKSSRASVPSCKSGLVPSYTARNLLNPARARRMRRSASVTTAPSSMTPRRSTSADRRRSRAPASVEPKRRTSRTSLPSSGRNRACATNSPRERRTSDARATDILPCVPGWSEGLGTVSA